jgi:chromosome segregation ATPase
MTWDIEITNIAGIRSGNATITEGVNAVRASNWQGKSSFLAALQVGMGVGIPLTEGTDRGVVRIEAGADEAVVTLHREGSEVRREGSPFLSSKYERTSLRLFGALGETNPIRRAVRNGENLRSLLTEPLDVEDIETTIGEKKREREHVETELERAEEAANRLPRVEQRIADLEEEVDQLEVKREELTDETGNHPAGKQRQELSDLRAERERVGDRINRLKDTIDRIDDRIEDHRQELDDITVTDMDSVAEELSEIREEYNAVKREADLARELYTANRRLLEEDETKSITDVEHGLVADTIECWVCGQETEREDIEATLDDLADRVTELRSQATEYESRIEELESRRDQIRSQQQEKQQLERDVADLEERRRERTESLNQARDRATELDEKIDEIEGTVAEETESITDIESELKYTRSQLEDARKERKELQREADQREMLKSERDDLTEEIKRLRSRKERIRRDTRESFRTHINELIEKFETGFEAARLTDNFDLVIAREGREASLDALSQGERELLGIVAGIAGYEAFNVAAFAPIIMLDNLGVLTDQNVETLVDHLRERTDYLVFTSYPEHTAFAGNEIDVSDWQVVSGDESVDTAT